MYSCSSVYMERLVQTNSYSECMEWISTETCTYSAKYIYEVGVQHCLLKLIYSEGMQVSRSVDRSIDTRSMGYIIWAILEDI